MAKISKKSLFLAAVALSAVFAFMLYRYLSTPVDGKMIIVAKNDIVPKTVITAEMVKEVSVPIAYIQPNSFEDKKKVVGSVSREAILAGAQITSRNLIVTGKPSGFASIIPSDKRAMTIAVNDESGVAGFTKPGDYVDLIVTMDQQSLGEPTSKTILNNVQILAYNHNVETGEEASTLDKAANTNTSKINTVTLAVNPMEAVQLALGAEKGKIRLALRPFMVVDNGVETTSVTPTSLIGSEFIPAPAPVYQAQPVQAEYVPHEFFPQEMPSAFSKTIQIIRGTKSENVFVD